MSFSSVKKISFRWKDILQEDKSKLICISCKLTWANSISFEQKKTCLDPFDWSKVYADLKLILAAEGEFP